MRTKRSGRRFRAAKREYVWATAYSPGIVISNFNGFFDEIPILSKADWARESSSASNLEKGATLVRVVGDVHFTMVQAIAGLPAEADATCLFGLMKRDEDDATVLDANVDAFSEDWMHLSTGYIGYANVSVATLSRAWGTLSWSKHIDVRVKRKLTSDERVSAFFAENPSTFGSAITMQATFLLRCLVQLP